MFKITKEWLDKHRTAKGGWTNAQWISLGITKEFMKVKGWKKHVIGGWITYEQKDAFEDAKTIYSTVSRDNRNRCG